MKMNHKLRRKIHHLHKKHKLHHRTMFYMQKGRNLHFHNRIITESFKILIVASIVSTIGGIGLQALQDKIILIIPLLVMLPALNDMIGDFGTIVSSRFATDLYLGKVNRSWWKSKIVNKLLKSIMVIAFITSFYISILSTAFSVYRGFPVDMLLFLKILLISLTTTMIIVGIVFFLSVIGGLYIYSKKKDPNNFLIPLTTSVADLGSMVIYSVLILMLI